MQFRIGHGYDLHRLVADRPLILCGECLPFVRGLLGHSDADVATHAVMDALLGAAALGDIGKLFPDNDPQYEGADSIALLQRVVALLAEHGWVPSNVDVTILAQAPKLAPYILEMRSKLAQTLGIALDCVSVKATTTEHLGFVGREEGIAAQAVVALCAS